MNARDVSLYTAAAVGGAIVVCSAVVALRVACQLCSRRHRRMPGARAPSQDSVPHGLAGRGPPPYTISGSLQPHPGCPTHGSSPCVHPGGYAQRSRSTQVYTGAPPYSALFGPGGSDALEWTAANTPPPSYNEAVNSEAFSKHLSADPVCQRT